MNKKERVRFIISHLPELAALFHGLFRIGTDSARGSGANVIRYNILKCLQLRGQQYLTDISICVHYKKNTLSELLDRMTMDGQVMREADARDRRKTNFKITPAGVQAIFGFEQEFVRHIDGFMKSLADAERDEFLHCLGALVQISKSRLEMKAVAKNPRNEAR